MSARTSGVRAAGQGLWMALGAPGTLLCILLVTMITAVPFALIVESDVRTAMAVEPPAPTTSASEIPADWWTEFRSHATGLAATFTPAILGFAAPLDSISALLDGTRQPLALMWPIGLAAFVWAFLWGGVLDRFDRGRSTPRSFLAASARHFIPLLLISIAAAVSAVIAYLTAHALLFGPIYSAASSAVSTERQAFAIRIVLYLLFGALLVLINAIFSFARVHVVTTTDGHAGRAIGNGWAFVRSNIGSVLSLYLIFLMVLAIVMAGYGALELLGGSRVGGWRAIVVGQAFVLFRLGMRLALAASQVRLARAAV